MTDVRWQIVAYVFVSIVLWTVAAQLSQRRPATLWGRRLREGWVASLLRFLYYIGLPYATLILGVMPARYLGLVGLSRLQANTLLQLREGILLVVLDWLGDVDTIAGLGLTMLVVLAATWLAYSRLKRGIAPQDAPTTREKTPSALQVLYQATHWSFYRGAVWLLTGDLYLGVIGGILLVGGEWLLASGWSNRAQHPLLTERLLVEASLLIAVSVIFFFVPNLWLLLPIHWLLAFVCQRAMFWGMANGQKLTGQPPTQMA